MSGSHAHVEKISSGKMWVATGITFAFCLGEAAMGYFSNSLALMADAGHNFADALALALSAFALWMATKPADSKRTFGYHRMGILAALVNAPAWSSWPMQSSGRLCNDFRLQSRFKVVR